MSSEGGETASTTATPSGTASAAAAASAPTPWFLYFMVVMLIALVVLIGLYCAALGDPDFPSRHHRGPNVTANAPRSLTSSAVLAKPVTGSIALPHEIPFELHRVVPSKSSKFIHPQLHVEQIGEQPQSQTEPLPVVSLPVAPSNLERAANMIGAITRQSIFGLAPIKQLSEPPSGQVLDTVPIAGIEEAVPDHVETGMGGPYVERVEWGDDGVWKVHGVNFDDGSQVVFGCDGRRVTASCQFQSSALLDCTPVVGLAGQKSEWRVIVTNSDSQSCELVAGLSSYYISFTPPGVPRRIQVGSSCNIGVGLYIGGHLELTAAPVSIWFEILQEEDSIDEEDGTNSISSRNRQQPAVIHESWVKIEKGIASFPNIVFSNVGKFTLRATAVQRVSPNTPRKIIAPIIESYPILIR